VLSGHYNAPANPSLLSARPVASQLAISEAHVTQGDTGYTELHANSAIEGAMAYCTIHAAQQDGGGHSGRSISTDQSAQTAQQQQNAAAGSAQSASHHVVIAQAAAGQSYNRAQLALPGERWQPERIQPNGPMVQVVLNGGHPDE